MVKVLIGKDWGGVDSLPEEFLGDMYENPKTSKYVETYDDEGETRYEISYDTQHSYSFRTDPNVIDMFESYFPDGYVNAGKCADIHVLKVDDDKYPYWYVSSNDGAEFIHLVSKNYHGFQKP